MNELNNERIKDMLLGKTKEITFPSIKILDSPFFENIVTSANKIQFNTLQYDGHDHITFTNCHFKKLIFQKINGRGIHLIDSTIEDLIILDSILRIEINRGYIKDLQFPTSNPVNTLVIKGNNETITIQKIDLPLNKIQTAQIWNSNLGNITISRTINEYRSCELKNVKVDDIKLLSICSGQNIEFKNIFPLKKNKSIFTIINSTPREIFLRDCNFRDFKLLKVSNSNLDGIKNENVKWFKKIIDEKTGKEDINAYRQLKGAVQKQYDGISETYFRAKEHDAHLKTLHPINDFTEWFLLLSNKYSNNHGLSWTRGLLFTFITTIIFFLAYLFSLDAFIISNYIKIKIILFNQLVIVNDFSINSFSNFLGYFSRFFIITHDFNFMSTFLPTGISFFIDVISRIFIGYGIYQTVQSFRKYGK